MGDFITHQYSYGLSTFKKLIVPAVIIALLIGIFVGDIQSIYSAVLNKPVAASTFVSSEIGTLSEQIKHLVKGLEYSDKVAEDFAKMVISWKDEKGKSVLVSWKKILDQAKEDTERGRISEGQLAKVKENMVKLLSERITNEIKVNGQFFDLADVIKYRQTQCLGYSQLVYILGNSIGLLIKPINVPIGVIKLVTGQLAESGHIACMVQLSDSKTMVIDIAFLPNFPMSQPFAIEKEFIKVSNYWELEDKDNPLGIYRRIQILDNDGLIASIYYNRANIHCRSGKYIKAIAEYSKTIELYPKFAEVYYSRGRAYEHLGRYKNAIPDYSKAIELNPEFFQAYNSRGRIYVKSGQFIKAISDFTQTIQLNPTDANAYYNRGIVFCDLEQETQAVSDFSKAIEINPKDAMSYYNRGIAYGKLGRNMQSIRDLTKATELNPNILGYITTEQ